MTPTARWFFVPISAVAVWYGALVLGLVGIAVLDALCPPDLVVSDLCTADWHRHATHGWMLFCTAVVAAALVLVPARMAPTHRPGVAAIFYVAGAIFALTAVRGGGLWDAFAVAGISGGAALWLVGRGAAAQRIA